MSKLAKIIVRSLIGILVLLILLYLFLPIKPRLSLLGYKLEDDVYGFTVGNETYQIEINSNSITAFTTDETPILTDISASFRFFEDSDSAATITVDYNNETGTCYYRIAEESTVTCDTITLSQNARDALKTQAEYHLIVIYFEFDWTHIPNNQR